MALHTLLSIFSCLYFVILNYFTVFKEWNISWNFAIITSHILPSAVSLSCTFQIRNTALNFILSMPSSFQNSFTVICKQAQSSIKYELAYFWNLFCHWISNDVFINQCSCRFEMKWSCKYFAKKFLSKPDNTFTILNNSKQCLTNLVSAGIIWYWQYIKYHCQYNTSIATALSQYNTDGFVSAWYHHGTDSGNLQKTFDAYYLT